MGMKSVNIRGTRGEYSEYGAEVREKVYPGYEGGVRGCQYPGLRGCQYPGARVSISGVLGC